MTEMKTDPHPAIAGETRCETIFRHTDAMLHALRISKETFAQNVVEAYCTLLLPEAQRLDFKRDGDPYAVAKINAQRLFRYTDAEGSTNLPCELEEAWVLSLEEPYRCECRRDLARRYGLMDVPLPDSDSLVCVQSLGSFASDMGKALAAMGPVLDDGKISAADAPLAAAAANQLEVLIAHAEGLLIRMRAVSGRAKASARKRGK